jgi:hypothetical protein
LDLAKAVPEDCRFAGRPVVARFECLLCLVNQASNAIEAIAISAKKAAGF